MYGNHRERIPDLLESPNSRRDLRNSRISNEHFRRYEAALSKYESGRVSPHLRRRLANNAARLEQQYHNFQGHSSSDECLTRNKSKSTSSIDTQSVNNILDEFEDLDYRRSSDLSDIDVGSIGVTNFEEMMDLQKRQVTEKQNSRTIRSQSQGTVSKDQQQHPVSPAKVNRQTQVQQRSRDRPRDSEKRFTSSVEESSRFERKIAGPVPQNQEVRASIRSAKAPPEMLLRKGEVQKRVDEWLNQTRSQNCAGFTRESRGLTRSNSSAEQKSHRRLRQQEIRNRRSQLNGSSSYDDLTHDGLRIEFGKGDVTKVSVGVNTSRGTYKQYLALKNKAKLQKQQQQHQQQAGVTVLRSREASPATPKNHHSRNEAGNSSFRSSSSKRQELEQKQQQQQQQQQSWNYETSQMRSKNVRARQQMENRISSLVKARNEMSESAQNSQVSAIRRSSLKRESMRNSSKTSSTNAAQSKVEQDTQTDQDQTNDVLSLTRNIDQENVVKSIDTNPLADSKSELTSEAYGSVSARVRAFQGRSEHRTPKTNSLQGSKVLIETRNRSPMSPTRNDCFSFNNIESGQSTFKPNERANASPSHDQNSAKRDIDVTTKCVEKIYETTLQPEVILADDLESVFKPTSTNFVYGETASKEVSNGDSGKRKTANTQNESENKSLHTGFNHCLKLLQKSPSFRLKRSQPVQKENDIFKKSLDGEQTILQNQPKPMNSFGTSQTSTPSNTVPQITASESKRQTSSSEQSIVPEKLDQNSYETRSTLKLNIKTVDDMIENDKNKRKDGSLKYEKSARQGIMSVSSSMSSSSNTIGLPEQNPKEDAAVINEVLVKNLQFMHDLPSPTPPAPPPRTCLESSRKQESALIVELTPLRSRPLNYNSVLSDDYTSNNARMLQQQQQDKEKIYVTKEEMEQKKLLDLLRRGEVELAKMVCTLSDFNSHKNDPISQSCKYVYQRVSS